MADKMAAFKLPKRSAAPSSVPAKPTSMGGISAVTKAMRRFSDRLVAVDPKVWTAKVSDLHKVFSIFQALFLTLEHYNEPMLRVGVELVCCREARRCLSWDENWFADEGQQEKFRRLVHEKLERVLSHMGAVNGMRTAAQEDKAAEEDTASQQQLQQLRDLEQKLQLAELKLQEATSREAELQERNGVLEQAATKYKAQERSSRDAQARVESAEARAQEAETAAEQAIAQAQEMRDRVSEAETAAQRAVAQVREMQADAARAQADAARAQADATRAQAAAAEWEKKFYELQKELQNGGGHARELERKVGQAGGDLNKAGQADPQECARCAKLEAENKHLKLLLEELQTKLRTMAAECKEEGLEDAFAKVMRRSGLQPMLEAVSVWDRLYRDAVDRIGRLDDLRAKYKKVAKKDLLEGVDDIRSVVEASPLGQVLSLPPSFASNAGPPASLSHGGPVLLSPDGWQGMPMPRPCDFAAEEDLIREAVVTRMSDEQHSHRTTARGRKSQKSLGVSGSQPSLHRSSKALASVGFKTSGRVGRLNTSASMPHLRHRGTSTGCFKQQPTTGTGFTIYGRKGGNWLHSGANLPPVGAELRDGGSNLAASMQKRASQSKHWR
eukprot:gnl/TRDRNA2_/TRDRNA2_152384_c0_seq1.p1 gnl/TRDRNA2_/TRDRNA2_152384_c0~~gnl/TRDRNA2_/TRDRNA2_152384_c0_seq1.p1  ORF type:complete len:614 (-),score=155.81 gnl/TRDRNA2_/TRDRNA2_152384_c0_seq1:168-2009(-)